MIKNLYSNLAYCQGKQFKIREAIANSYYIISNFDGYHKAVFSWDVDGHQLSEAYYGPNGKPKDCPKGYASFICEYDVKGNLVREVYYDENGKITDVLINQNPVSAESIEW